MLKILFACLGLLALFTGCATTPPKTVALQTKPTAYVATRPIQVSSIEVNISDERDDRAMDYISGKRGSDEAAEVIRAALTTSKWAVVQPGTDQVLQVRGALVKLQWFVPDYHAMLKKVFATSLLTGGLGGVAYGSTSTPVEGHAVLKIVVLREGKEILQCEYAGSHQETIAKLKCDSMETKSRVAGAALSAAIDKLLADLDATSAVPGDSNSPPNPTP